MDRLISCVFKKENVSFDGEELFGFSRVIIIGWSKHVQSFMTHELDQVRLTKQRRRWWPKEENEYDQQQSILSHQVRRGNKNKITLVYNQIIANISKYV